ncbi:hypothetical protein AcW1_009748 [Taiwanofungus camphoratus]|nr:hypothetical protein AcV5_002354 [Antrodia cinnamomea]KAI0941893.1 hypothetical protein AcV7_002457 [Antrodia cinnamomea]KAI0948159.1 hypothetical protein AcW1_009748 [Antrodia cinnamomea]
MVLSNDIAALIGFGCEAVLYGAYCILFLISLHVLIWRRRSRDLNTPLLFANCMLFFSCTAHFALEFNHYYTTLQATGVPNFANETKRLFGADILISLIDFMGDMVLIYRCWLVWGKNYWVIILPFLTAVSGFACLMEVMHLLLSIDPSAPVAPAQVVPLGIAGYALPLCTNVLVTALIVVRIWYASLKIPDAGLSLGTRRTTRHAMSIVVESGALYLAVQLVFVVLFSIKHPAQAIVAVMAVQIYGIAPTLIIIRVGLGITTEPTHPIPGTHISWGFPTSNQDSTTRITADSRFAVITNDIELGSRKSLDTGKEISVSSSVAI